MRVPLNLGAATVNDIAASIQSHEGYAPGTLSYRNNNPGNLVYAGQPGATKDPNSRFAVFPTYADGQAAMVAQINRDLTRGCPNGSPVSTLNDLIGCWAPASENNTTAYVSDVATRTGLDPNAGLLAQLAAGTTAPSPDQSFPADTPVDQADLAPLALGAAAFAALLYFTRRI
jgi:hypothetical protein